MKKFEEIERKGNEIVVGMGATGRYWTDCYPFEVVRVISDKTVEIRALDEKMISGDWLDAEYEYYVNESHPVERVRKTKMGWKTKDGMRVGFGGARYYRDPSF